MNEFSFRKASNYYSATLLKISFKTYFFKDFCQDFQEAFNTKIAWIQMAGTKFDLEKSQTLWMKSDVFPSVIPNKVI